MWNQSDISNLQDNSVLRPPRIRSMNANSGQTECYHACRDADQQQSDGAWWMATLLSSGGVAECAGKDLSQCTSAENAPPLPQDEPSTVEPLATLNIASAFQLNTQRLVENEGHK